MTEKTFERAKEIKDEIDRINVFILETDKPMYIGVHCSYTLAINAFKVDKTMQDKVKELFKARINELQEELEHL